jgi:hypothetical protein
MQITTEIIEGTTYYIMTLRGVRYTISFDQLWEEWRVMSRRLSLGRMNTGSTRHFKTLADVEAKIKGLRGISALLEKPITAEA